MISAAAERAPWEVERYDVLLDAKHDLTDQVLLQELCRRLRAGEFSLLFVAPPCGTFSSFVRLSPTSSRSLARPAGGGRGRPLTPKERLPNRLLRMAVRLVQAADEGVTPWSLENPAGSLL